MTPQEASVLSATESAALTAAAREASLNYFIFARSMTGSEAATATAAAAEAVGADPAERSAHHPRLHGGWSQQASGPRGRGSDGVDLVSKGCRPPRAGDTSRETERPGESADGCADSGEWATDVSCIICLGDYTDGDQLCRLPCRHVFHAKVGTAATACRQRSIRNASMTAYGSV